MYDFDKVLRSSLTQILNTQLDDEAWQQVTLPIKLGGLGITSTIDLSASAFLQHMELLVWYHSYYQTLLCPWIL